MDEDEYREPHAGDDPVAAFERLRGEVSLLRHAVEGLTAARESIDIPDYQPTLERTEKVLGVLAQQIAAMRKSPALSMDPAHMAGEIATAAIGARREDSVLSPRRARRWTRPRVRSGAGLLPRGAATSRIAGYICSAVAAWCWGCCSMPRWRGRSRV